MANSTDAAIERTSPSRTPTTKKKNELRRRRPHPSPCRRLIGGRYPGPSLPDVTPKAAALPERLVRLFIGLVLFGAGIGLQVQSELGLPPWDVLHQGLARRTPLTIGTATIAVGVVVLLLWIPLRERPGFGTIANAIVVGLTIDATIGVVAAPEWLALRWMLMLGGIVVVAIGSGFYIGAQLGPGPRDGLMTGIARRGVSIRLARTAVEGSALIIGWLLGGTVGIGTLAFTVLIGPLVHIFLPRLEVARRSSRGRD